MWWTSGQNHYKLHPHNLTSPPSNLLSAHRVRNLSAMKDCWLISEENLCDDGFAVNFDANYIFQQKINHVLIGYRDTNTVHYLIDFNNL